jgi:hypothetical protein
MNRTAHAGGSFGCNKRHSSRSKNVIFFLYLDLVVGAGEAMRRREFIAFVGGTAAAWPLAARAQKSGKVPIIGFLGATTPSVWSAFVDAFLQRLRELGRIDGSTVAIEYRWAQGRDELYSEFAAGIPEMNSPSAVFRQSPKCSSKRFSNSQQSSRSAVQSQFLSYRWNCNEILVASPPPLSPPGYGSAFHKVRFRG